MNMNKILAAGLIAAVASTASFAQCGNGGFYVGANAGVAFTKMKIATDAKIKETADATATSAAANKKKTKFLGELVLGYDHRINDVMLGLDATFGMMFGKTNAVYNGSEGALNADDATELTTEGKVSAKNDWSIALMPRVGYLVMPQLELYATAGVKFAHFKLNYAKDVKSTDAANFDSAKKVKVVPVVGGGIRYEITPSIYTKLEYNYDFKKGLKLTNNLQDQTDTGGKAKSAKIPAHIIKLGVGFRF